MIKIQQVKFNEYDVFVGGPISAFVGKIYKDNVTPGYGFVQTNEHIVLNSDFLKNIVLKLEELQK